MPTESHIHSRSEADTRRAGERLGRSLEPGDAVLLRGNLGMGKTVFARGAAVALGVPEEEIRSPSFTLVNPYTGTFPVFHVDLYRIEKTEDLDELGLEEVLGTEGVALVEWAERLGPYRPEHCVEVTINDAGGRQRDIRIEDHRSAAPQKRGGSDHSRR